MSDIQYHEADLEDFVGNPCINALKPPRDPDQVIQDLMIFPKYYDWQRNEPVAKRRLLTQNLARIHQPLSREMEIEAAIDRCIRWGYVDRNPLSSEYAALLSKLYAASVERHTIHTVQGYHPHTYGFAILGISGIGKSTTVETILSYYPKIIRHSNYNGTPLSIVQIPWIKLDCAPDGSLKGICLAFFQKIDALVGTNYFEQFRKRSTLDVLMLEMAHLALVYNVGLIVLDELQNVCTAAKDISAKVLNFFVTLVNTIGVPVVMIGTPKALTILQNEFQQAKRGSGQGDALWERMQNDSEWDTFCEAIWRYQYTKEVIPYSPEMRNALYSEALGIPFLAVHIYKLVQEDAILYGKETFSSKDFKRIADTRMGLTKPMRAAMQVGKEVDMQQFKDIAPFHLQDYKNNYSIAADTKDAVKKVPEKMDARKAATLTLMGLGLSQPEANSFVCNAITCLKECAHETQIAREAYRLYTERKIQEPVSVPLSGMSGYDDLLAAGMIDASPTKEVLHGHA